MSVFTVKKLQVDECIASLLLICAFLLDLNLLFLLPIVVFMVYYILENRLVIRQSAFDYLFLTTLLLTIISMIYLENLSLTFFMFFLFFVKIRNFSFNDAVIEYFLYIQITFVFIQLFFPDSISAFVSLISDNRIVIIDYSEETWRDRRMTGLFTNPNYTALFLVIFYCLHVKNNWPNFSLLCLLIVSLAVILTGSRAGFLSLIVCVLQIYCLNKNSRQKLHLFGFGVLSILFFYSEELNFRVLVLLDLFNGIDNSSISRINSITRYISDLEDTMSLLFGRGYIDFTYFFDGDLGNVFFMLGVLGTLFLILHLIFIGKNSMYLHFTLISTSPFIAAAGIFGNQKLLFVVFLLYSVCNNSQTTTKIPMRSHEG